MLINEMRKFINLMESKTVEVKIANGDVIISLDASDANEVTGSLWWKN